MKMIPLRVSALGLVLGTVLTGCATQAMRPDRETVLVPNAPVLVSDHRQNDDLLTAGLGLAGLRSPTPPAFADPAAPTAQELRRRAIWTNWRGIADLVPGTLGDVYGTMPSVPGREFSALAKIEGASQPHRVLLQVPDAFNPAKPCLVVAASSGSRGVYGAIAVAGPWALPKGCAVAYTDKGAGTDYVDLQARTGAALDGTAVTLDQAVAFRPTTSANAGVAFKHAHSGDNPEADWGRHVKQAAQFGVAQLRELYPNAGLTLQSTRIIALGISNGGGAVLRAAELEGDWLDAVVAGEPNVQVAGARALYDYATEAALLMPCAMLDFDDLPQSPLTKTMRPMGALRCASLASAGIITGSDAKAQARAAHAALRNSGWSETSLRASALSVDFDLWRAIAATYASAYGRYGVGEHPCGFAFSAQNPDFTPRAATAAERAAWWSDASGIPPGAGVGLIDTRVAAPDFTLPGVQCLRSLWTDATAGARVHKGVAELQAGLPRDGIPVVIVHGMDDNVVPATFSSAPYVVAAQAAGRDVRYWLVRNAQHFDGFLALPDYRARYVPLLPYVYAALDRVNAHLDDASVKLPGDAVINARPAAAGNAGDLAIPR